ncbi:MAG TPA: hypothetical protein VMN04_13410, partial [Thermoanaerobaculia bacterium]|nr:hypothetical protein [Thermoanaerobaculia bacterium]
TETLAAVFLLLAGPARAESLFEPTTGIRVDVGTDGSYAVESGDPPLAFRGELGVAAADIDVRGGTDGIGTYREIAFRVDDASGRSGLIRTYESRPLVRFAMTWRDATPNTGGFPRLTVVPEMPYKASFLGKWSIFRFDEAGTEGPWTGFDASGRAYVLSAAANFMVAYTARTPSGAIETRIHPAIASLPAGFTHEALLAVGNGINRTFDVWGRGLTDAQGKARPASDADPALASLGYWTDDGAAYYYACDPRDGYEGTLLAVRDAFARAGVSLGYVQLDSWWYPKGETLDWDPLPNQWEFGIGLYEAHPSLFPRGLADFQERLGLPLITHARWIDEKSPYRREYRMSNDVVVDPAYWTSIAGYLAEAGVFAYEQDWLDQKATAAFTLDDQNAFMDNMARAMKARGLTMQYCMGTPRHLLQSAKYENLTTARLSEDCFGPGRWDQFVYSSRLAAALGVWPWADVFRSSERDNLLLAALSAGAVGVGDALGEIVPANLSMAARADGTLVKPDAPLVPTDATILSDARQEAGPLVAATSTEHAGARAVYVFAHARGAETSATIDPAALGFAGRVYVWDFLAGTGRVVDAAAPLAQDLVDTRAYTVLVPVGSSGIALVGDEGKFATLGRKRIAAADDARGRFCATVVFGAGERTVTLLGWSPVRPRVAAPAGVVGSVAWDSVTGVFRIAVHPGRDGMTASIVLSAGGGGGPGRRRV